MFVRSRPSVGRPGLRLRCIRRVQRVNRLMRADGRQANELRPLTFKRRYTRQAPGSVLVHMGRTTVLCTCTLEKAVPPFLVRTGKGWLTAEYGMLPGSTA